MNRSLRVLIFGQIVPKTLQRDLNVTWAHAFGPGRFKDAANLVGERRLLEQVRSFSAGLNFDSFAFAQAGEGLQRLADENDATFGLLALGQKIGKFAFGGVVGVLIFDDGAHRREFKQTG